MGWGKDPEGTTSRETQKVETDRAEGRDWHAANKDPYGTKKTPSKEERDNGR